MKPPRIHHYAITAPGAVLDEVVSFYGNALGLTPGERPDFGIPGYWLYAGDEPILHLIQDDNREAGSAGYLDHVALRCEGLEETKSRLEAHGIEYGQMQIDMLNQTQLFLRDPAGTSIELNFIA